MSPKISQHMLLSSQGLAVKSCFVNLLKVYFVSVCTGAESVDSTKVLVVLEEAVLLPLTGKVRASHTHPEGRFIIMMTLKRLHFLSQCMIHEVYSYDERRRRPPPSTELVLRHIVNLDYCVVYRRCWERGSHCFTVCIGDVGREGRIASLCCI